MDRVGIAIDEIEGMTRQNQLSQMGCGRIEWVCPDNADKLAVIPANGYPVTDLPCPCGDPKCWVLKWNPIVK